MLRSFAAIVLEQTVEAFLATHLAQRDDLVRKLAAFGLRPAARLGLVERLRDERGANRLLDTETGLQNIVAAASVIRTISFEYDAAGQLLEASDPAATYEYTLDGMGRGTDLAGYEYEYDAASRITAIDSLIDGLTEYQHDFTGQLTDADHTGIADEAYEYDENGNRVMGGYAVGDNNRIESDGTYDYEYDDEGNLTAKETIATGERVEYTWDHRNRLTKVTYKDGLGAVTKTVDQAYDAFNRWIRSTTDADGPGGASATERFFVYEDGQMVYVLAGANASDLTDRLLWSFVTDQLLADEQVTSLAAAGEVVWPLTDHLGTVRDLAVYDVGTDTTTVENHRVYDSFGNLVSETNAGLTIIIGFTGRPLDAETGLQNNWNRWYISSLGVWASEDPIGFGAADSNLRRYVKNSQANYVDPNGLEMRDGDQNDHPWFPTGPGAIPPSGWKPSAKSIEESRRQAKDYADRNADAVTGIVPVVSDVRDATELVTGRDAWTGEKLGSV